MKDLDQAIYDFLRSDVVKTAMDHGDYNLKSQGVSLTYLIERLVINHIRLWNLEDKIRLTDSDIERSNIKRQIDYLNSQQRPRLVEAIGSSFIKALAEKDPTIIAEPNLKKYGKE